MSNILQGKEEYFTLIQKYSHYQPVGRMIEYNQIKGKGGERAVSEYVLELKGITKIFPGVKALNNVQFQLKPGEVHALMGENGAGKSTFIKVITGVHKAEEGEMFLNGQKVDFKGPKDAQEAGIAAVYQHPTSYPHLTVAENIFMGHEIIKHHMIQWKEMNQEANKYLKELDADFGDTEFETLNGYLTNILGHIPTDKDIDTTIKAIGYCFTILSIGNKTIGKVKVERDK